MMQTPSKNIKKISGQQVRMKDSVEKQLLVLNFLDNLEGKTPAKQTKSRSKEACDSELEHASDEPGFEIGEKEELNRHAMKYSGWRKSSCLQYRPARDGLTPELFQSLLDYAEETHFVK
ncbi:unnamed protein product, partial [Symbiodinium sp. CCMP2456]